MAYDLEEQEQLATLKAWWAKYGNLVSWLVAAALAVYAGWSAWKYYQRDQAAKAAVLYEEIVKAADAKEHAKVLRAAGDMKDKFGATSYAAMGSLVAAKTAFEQNDLKAAKAQLQWVIEQGKGEEFPSIARIRLAGILLDEKAYDEGLKVLSADFPEQFAALVADRRGDLLVAQEKFDEARTAYKAALDKTEVKNPARQLIQLKLDAIGGAPVQAG